MSAFCKKCGCVADPDSDYCFDHSSEQGKEIEAMDCAFMCNGSCRSCGQPTVYVTMLPVEKWGSRLVAMNPELEHGGNIEIRRNKSGRLFAKETGPDPEQRKFIMHSAACIGRKKNSKADALMPDVKTASQPNHRKTWQEERSEKIRDVIEMLS